MLRQAVLCLFLHLLFPFFALKEGCAALIVVRGLSKSTESARQNILF